MIIHALQTGTVAIKTLQRRGSGTGPLRLVNTFRDREWTEPLPIYAWLIEHPEGLIVVDTGETARASEPSYFPSWHPYFRTGLRESVDREEEIDRRLGQLGFSTDDVRWVVMTHLHTDHAGGLQHFPKSEILVSRAVLEAASGRTGRLRGYLSNRFPNWFAPRAIDFLPERFRPFSEIFPLTQAGDVRLVPTPGHTRGHLAVFVDEDEHVVCLAGDSSYTEALLLEEAVDGVSPDETKARETLVRLRALAGDQPTVYLPSHDPASGHRLVERLVAGRAEPAEVAA